MRKKSFIFRKYRLLWKIFLLVVIFTLLGPFGVKSVERKEEPAPAPSATSLREDFRLLIPKIGVDAPIIADVDGANKKAYFSALENGVAQLKGSSKPGEGGNIFIFGHSSFYPWSPGDYKEIFKNLENLALQDEIIIWHQKKEYKYTITDVKIVLPSEVDVAGPSQDEKVTLMTCWPTGTTLKRLLVVGKP